MLVILSLNDYGIVVMLLSGLSHVSYIRLSYKSLGHFKFLSWKWGRVREKGAGIFENGGGGEGGGGNQNGGGVAFEMGGRGFNPSTYY